jgi:hypothetical protein
VTKLSEVYLELFVIADKQARCKRLSLELSDQYHFFEKVWRYGELLPGFTGKTYHQSLGHPITEKYMWNGCVLSKLCGTLKPGQMDKDIAFQLKTHKPYRKHYYSHRGARETGFVACLGAWCILAIGLTAIFYGKIKKENGRKFYLFRIIIPAALFSLIIWPTFYGLVPKVKVQTKRGYFRDHYSLRLMHSIGAERVKEYIDLHEMDKKAIEARIREYFDFRISRDAFNGERIRLEDSPGNFTILEDERGIVFRAYSRNGFPIDIVVKSTPEDGYELPRDNIVLLSPEQIQYHVQQILSHLELLSSKEKRLQAVQLLRMSGQKEVVKPIIDSLEPFDSRYIDYADWTLTRLTGYNFATGRNEREAHRLWSRWWEENKDKTRHQWLREALNQPNKAWNNWGAFIAAQELSKLGDDTGVPILLQQFSSGTQIKPRIEAAAALARLERKEGIDFLKETMQDEPNLPRAIRGLLTVRTEEADQLLISHARGTPTHRSYSMIANGLRDRYPKRIASIVLDHLLLLSSQETIYVKKMEADVNLLAQIARIIPPLDVTDKQKINEFIKEIEAWCKLN